MRAIDVDELIAKLGIAHDCSVCKKDEGPYCRWKPNVVDVCEAINDAPTIEPERKTGKWIPCSERLPEEHIGFYLVTVQKRRITALNVVGCDNTVHDIDIARWDYDRRAPQRGYHWCKADKVIAWMPLPEPYKEGKPNED